MDTILVKCDTISLVMKESALACPASTEWVNTNGYDVTIVLIICVTTAILGFYMKPAFLKKISVKEAGVTSFEKSKWTDEGMYEKVLRDKFLSFCEAQIKDGKDPEGKLLKSYKKVLSKYLPGLKEGDLPAGEKDSKISGQ